MTMYRLRVCMTTDPAHKVCAAGFMKWLSIRPSIRLSVCPIDLCVV